jgi:hypothetical protein
VDPLNECHAGTGLSIRELMINEGQQKTAMLRTGLLTSILSQ